MQQYSNGYIIGFAAAVCLVCSVIVSGSAVSLRDRQDLNKILDRQKKVLTVAGLMEEGQKISADQVSRLFEENIRIRLVDLESGEYNDSLDATQYDQRKATKDPELSEPAPANKAGLQRVPKTALVYQKVEGDAVEMLILPIEGKGLWSTLYGFIALAPDTVTIRGITFYEHGETPGLGGEVDNPSWKALWKDRKAYRNGEPAIEVIKGHAGPAAEDPYHVDGLSGATLTARGVSQLVRFWLGENGFQPYLERFKAEGGTA